MKGEKILIVIGTIAGIGGLAYASYKYITGKLKQNIVTVSPPTPTPPPTPPPAVPNFIAYPLWNGTFDFWFMPYAGFSIVDNYAGGVPNWTVYFASDQDFTNITYTSSGYGPSAVYANQPGPGGQASLTQQEITARGSSLYNSIKALSNCVYIVAVDTTNQTRSTQLYKCL